MKVRIGYGLGNLRPLSGEALGALAEGLERNGFDSLWLSERISGPAPDPVIALTFAAARTKKIKLGTSVQVLPGRSPARLAKSWATLDALSGGRALPAFGLGIVHPVEQQAFGVERKQRAAIFDEALPLIRRLWEEDAADHDGEHFHYEGMTVLPHPKKHLDVWLGGKAALDVRRGRQTLRRLARVVQHARRLQGVTRHHRRRGGRGRAHHRRRSLRRDGLLLA